MVPEETQDIVDALPKAVMVTTGELVSSMIPEISQQCSNLSEAALPLNVEEDSNRSSDDAAVTILDQEFREEFVFPFPDPASTLEIQGSGRSEQGVNGSCSSPSSLELLTSRAASSGGVQAPSISYGGSTVNVSADTSFANNSMGQNPRNHFPFFNDPYDYQLEKLRRDEENLKKNFEETTSELMAELERKMAEVRSEYDRQSQDVDAAYNAKVMEEKTRRSFIGTHSLLANAFTFKCSENSSATDVASVRARSVQHPNQQQQQAVQTNTHVYSTAPPPPPSVTAAEASVSYSSGPLLQPPRVTMTQPRPISQQAAAQSNRYVSSTTPRSSVTAAEAPTSNPSAYPTPIHQQGAVQSNTHVNSTGPPQPSVTVAESPTPNPSGPLSQFPRRTTTQPRPISQQTTAQPNTHINPTSMPRPSVTAEARSLHSLRSNTSQPRPPPIVSNLTPSSTPPVHGIVRAMAPHLRSSRAPPNSTALATTTTTTTTTTTYPRRLVQEPQQQQGKNSNSGLVYLSDDEE